MSHYEKSYGTVRAGGYTLSPSLYTFVADEYGVMQPVTEKDTAGNTVEVRAFKVGQTYTIKVRGVNSGIVDGKTVRSEGAWSEPVSYTPVTAEVAVPAKILGLSYKNETLSWNPLDDNIDYEIEIKDGTNEFSESAPTKDANGNWVTDYYDIGYYSSLSVSNLGWLNAWKISGEIPETVTDTDGNAITAFKRGQTYTVRVRAYDASGAETKYGEWSDGLTFTFAEKTVAAPAKVSELDLQGTTLSWKADAMPDSGSADYTTRYEIQVVGADGTQYGTSATVQGTTLVYSNYAINGYYAERPKVTIGSLENALYTYKLQDGEAVKSVYPTTNEFIKPFEKGKTYTISVRAIRVYNDTVKEGEWSNPVSYNDEAPTIKGNNTVPAKVTGVKVETDAADKYENLSEALLHWNYLENVTKYEICVVDAAGNEYSESFSVEEGALVKDYYEVGASNTNGMPSISMSDLKNLKVYLKKPEAAVSTMKDTTTGKELKTFAGGQTYSFKVRAVNVYRELGADDKYGDPVELPGEWSDVAGTYTAPVMAQITNLKSSSSDEDYYYFTFDEALANTDMYYQIAVDQQCTSFVTGRPSHWVHYQAEETPDLYKLAIRKDAFDLAPATTYYVRAVNSTEMPNSDEVAKMTFVSAAFTTDAQAVPKNITGLEWYDTTEYSYKFRFDPVLNSKADDYYVLQYTNKANAAEEDWVSYEIYNKDDAYIPVGLLKEGTNYVRAVAYIEVDGKKVYGTPSNVVEIPKSTATSAVGDLTYAEKNQDGYLFKITGTPRKDEDVEFWYSTAEDFASDKNVTMIESDSDGQYQIDFTELTPGKTYYVRARVYNSIAKQEKDKYSTFSNTVTFKANMARISVNASVTSTSVTLSMNGVSDQQYLSGYQIQKKVNKKYVTLTRTTDDTYKESGLKKDTTYTYRIRPYYYNTETGKTTTGIWKYYQTMTWGSSLGLSALAKSKTSIKLSWNKVSGASGYEIYRKVSSSDATTVTGGKSNEYEKYTLVKTITKASTKSYTDKKLMSGLTYDYMVRAYRKVGTKKYYITDYVSVKTGFGDVVQVRRTVKYTNGKVKVYWTPNYSADGYVIEKYDDTTDQWTVVAKKKKSTYAYTFPAASKDTHYRIRAYRGTEFSDAYELTVYPYLATVTGVNAKANAADGSITVSWKPVAGADYYRVFRTTSSYSVYDKTSKTYYHNASTVLDTYVADEATISGYKKLEYNKLTDTSMVDRPIVYTANGVTKTVNEGPTQGVKYYYYVIAYKNGVAYNYEDTYDDTTDSYSGGSKLASATVTQVTVKKPTMKSLKVAKGKITVRWKKVSKAQGYVIYRSTKKSSGYSKIALVTKGSATSYVDKTVKAKTKYYYVVKAIRYNEAGAMTYSSSSKKKSATAK